MDDIMMKVSAVRLKKKLKNCVDIVKADKMNGSWQMVR